MIFSFSIEERKKERKKETYGWLQTHVTFFPKVQ
jgi:hypothetical protein